MMYRPAASAKHARMIENDGYKIREALAGNLGLSALPLGLAMQVEAILRRRERQRQREEKRTRRANRYILQPHGERECARRRRQIAAGSLTAANGLAS